MNINLSRNNFIRRGWLFAMLLAVSCPLPGLHAEPEEREVHGRFLFIFDTSAGMKKRVPAVELAVNTMLATSISGQLHKGDTIGVWTFSQDLHPGDFPLQMWEPDDAAVIATNLAYFIRTRKYENKTRFEALQPLLRRVVQSSERLTVLIFSDGATKITGTTFDTGINQLFATNAAAQKKAREPFVVVLRSQLGKYVGCTVSCPPQLASLPQFPPLPPPPPAPKPVVAVVPPVAPVVATPSLLITGTKVEAASIPPASPPPVIESAPAIISPSNAPVAVTPPATVVLPVVPVVPVVPTNVAVAPTNPPVVIPVASPVPPTNVLVSAPPVPPAAPTNLPVAPPALVAPTNASPVALASIPAVTMTPTNPSSPKPANAPVAVENQAATGKNWPLIGGLCIIAAGLVVALVVLRSRRSERGSLISRSMHDR